MPSKQKALVLKYGQIRGLKHEVQLMEQLDVKKLYQLFPEDTIGYIETFNLDSFRMKVIASNCGAYSDTKSLGRYRRDIGMIPYCSCCIEGAGEKKGGHVLRPFPISDLSLLVNYKFKSHEYEMLMSGRNPKKFL